MKFSWIYKKLTKPFVIQISNVPQWIKYGIILNFIEHYKIKNFYESGTHLGLTLKQVADTGISCTSVELGDDLHKQAKSKFAKYKNIELIHGDSGKVLPEIIDKFTKPTLFWLDGHYSGKFLGVQTAKGDKHTPINEELATILNLLEQGDNMKSRGHIVLIDDAKLFDGQSGYPTLGDMVNRLQKLKHYRTQVTCDMIQVTPRKKPK